MSDLKCYASHLWLLLLWTMSFQLMAVFLSLETTQYGWHNVQIQYLLTRIAGEGESEVRVFWRWSRDGYQYQKRGLQAGRNQRIEAHRDVLELGEAERLDGRRVLAMRSLGRQWSQHGLPQLRLTKSRHHHQVCRVDKVVEVGVAEFIHPSRPAHHFFFFCIIVHCLAVQKSWFSFWLWLKRFPKCGTKLFLYPSVRLSVSRGYKLWTIVTLARPVDGHSNMSWLLSWLRSELLRAKILTLTRASKKKRERKKKEAKTSAACPVY